MQAICEMQHYAAKAVTIHTMNRTNNFVTRLMRDFKETQLAAHTLAVDLPGEHQVTVWGSLKGSTSYLNLDHAFLLLERRPAMNVYVLPRSTGGLGAPAKHAKYRQAREFAHETSNAGVKWTRIGTTLVIREWLARAELNRTAVKGYARKRCLECYAEAFPLNEELKRYDEKHCARTRHRRRLLYPDNSMPDVGPERNCEAIGAA